VKRSTNFASFCEKKNSKTFTSQNWRRNPGLDSIWQKKKDSILCDTLVKEFIPKKAWCCQQITSRLSCTGPSWVSFTGEFSPNFNYGKMISTCSKDFS
jgi:hypothetical protein